MFTKFWEWTGIGEKKGWDFLQLIIIPIVIFWGTQYFSEKSNEQQQEIATDRYRQEALTKYFEQMSQLLLDKNLRKEGSEARTIARARTLSTLRELDGFRKGLLIKFLAEAELVSKEKVVISVVDANLKGADLSGADLKNTDLIDADLSGAHLVDARLINASLINADLSGAYFIRTDLKNTDLKNADLRDAYFSEVKNLGKKKIKSACFWEEAIYTDADWNNEIRKWVVKDKKANQKRIEEIKRDKASDPKTPPNCNRWN